MSDVTLIVEPGRDRGTGAAKRLRQSGRIPGVVYGEGGQAVPVSVPRSALRHALTTPQGINVLLQLQVGDAEGPALVKEVQRHPVRREVIHVDFHRVAPGQEVEVKVPIRLTGEARKVTTAGGMTEQRMDTLKVRCRVEDIPASIDADISGMTLGRSLQVKDLVLAEGSRTLVDPNKAVVTTSLTRAAVQARQAGREGND